MRLIFFLFLFSYSLAASCCTTFVIKDSSSLVFGRNLDWVSNDGVVVVNKRNIRKRALVFAPDQPAEWKSKYGSVTFNQFGKEFPFGGINEKGLVVEIMLVSGKYPKRDHRKAVNELQWIQYQLDNCNSVKEVLATEEFIRISKINQNLHFLVADASGEVAVIEYNYGKQKVYQGKDLIYPVLENDTYETSLWNKEKNKSCRFNTAVSMINDYYIADTKKDVIDYSFQILEKVKLDGSWSIVYDIKQMKIYFNTSDSRRKQFFNLNEFDFGCSSPSLLFDLKIKVERNISKRFVEYNKELNRKKFDSGMVSNGIFLPESIYKMFIGYNESCICENQ